MPNSPSVIIERVTKRFGTHEVLSSISLNIFPAQHTLIVGPNGAGKSTLMQIIAGIVRADSGSVTRPELPVGFVGPFSMLSDDLTVKENLQVYRAAHGLIARDEELLAPWLDESVLHERVRELSSGQRTRLALVRALLGKPRLLLLDEPTSMLDDAGCELLREHIAARLQEGMTIVTVSHDLSRLLRSAQRAILLHSGKVQADSSAGTSVDAVISNYSKGNR